MSGGRRSRNTELPSVRPASARTSISMTATGMSSRVYPGSRGESADPFSVRGSRIATPRSARGVAAEDHSACEREVHRLRGQVTAARAEVATQREIAAVLRRKLERRPATPPAAVAETLDAATQHVAELPACTECAGLAQLRLELLAANEAQATRHAAALKEAEDGVGALDAMRQRVSQLEADKAELRSETLVQRGRAARLESERDELLKVKRERDRHAARVAVLETELGTLQRANGQLEAMLEQAAPAAASAAPAAESDGEDDSFPAVLQRELQVMARAYEDKIQVLKDAAERKEWELRETIRAINDTARSERVLLKGRISTLESQVQRERGGA